MPSLAIDVSNRIVALWAHPRSLSTALERVFIERGDFHVMHEPFSALYYVGEKRAPAAQAQFENPDAIDYESIREKIISAAENQDVFLKDMCYHCYVHIAEDEPLLSAMSHTFLLREPRQTIASHYAKNPDVTLEEIGYEKQARLFEIVRELAAEVPLVIASEDLQRNPEIVLSAICERLEIEQRPDALNWQPGQRDEWTEWKPWHGEVARSSGIHTQKTSYPDTVDNHPRLAELYAHHQPFYEELFKHRVRV